VADAPVPTVSKRRGLAVRLTVAPLVLAFLLGVLLLHVRTGVAYGTDLVLVLFAAGAAFEVGAMLAKASRPGHPVLSIAFAAALCGTGFVAPDAPATREVLRALLLVGAVVAVFVCHLRAPRPGDLDRILSTFVPVLLVGWLFGILRELGDGSDGGKRIAFVAFASKASDVGGWIVGKSIGRHKMIPSVSPGKTWEGTIGGVLFSVGTGLLLHATWGAGGLVRTPMAAAALGALLGAASIVAGLAHSALKRRCGVKDSSTLLPEMGGLLDMIDSLLLAAPVAWIAWIAG
jgi:phosphatidate cytidylyltransferase